MRVAIFTSNGRYVTFYSYATNLVPGDTNGQWDIFVHDRQQGSTVRANVSSTGEQANAYSSDPTVSSNGIVAFDSQATNLVIGDTNNSTDMFLHDLQTGVTRRVSVSSSGVAGQQHRLRRPDFLGRTVHLLSELRQQPRDR